MTGGQKTILFWVMTILCFLSPFIFFAFYKDKNVIIEMHPKPTQTSPFITIHVSGAVRNPGIYKIKPGTKVHEILSHFVNARRNIYNWNIHVHQKHFHDDYILPY